MTGVWQISWVDMQQQYNQLVQSWHSRRRWLVAVIKKMWDISWDLWDHWNGIVHDKELSVELEEVNIEIREELRMRCVQLPWDMLPLFRQNCQALLQNTATAV